MKNKISSKVFLIFSLASILLGANFYFIEKFILKKDYYIANYLPDGLWASSFTAIICYIWIDNKKCRSIWFLLIILIMFLFEILQYSNVIRGTGDINDMFIYLLFSLPIFILSFKLNIKKN